MEKLTSAVESASVYVANHFDTVEKVTINVTGVVLAAFAFWLTKKSLAAMSYAARHAYAAAKSRVSPEPDPVFARLLQHFDDPDAMYTVGVTTIPKLETGTIVAFIHGDGTVASVLSGKYDLVPDLSDKERKLLNARAKAKVAEVIERDRLARRAALSAPKAV